MISEMWLMTEATPNRVGVPPRSCRCQNKKAKTRPMPSPMNQTTKRKEPYLRLEQLRITVIQSGSFRLRWAKTADFHLSMNSNFLELALKMSGGGLMGGAWLKILRGWL